MSTSPKDFKLILVDPQSELCEEWEKSFKDIAEVEIFNGIFQQVKEYDCIVSPANSYGLMDGGVDLAIRTYFGMRVQYNIQKRIQKEFYGEQPVGTSMIEYTEHEDHPLIAHTPTMSVPMDISKTYNVYHAFFALLRTVANYNKQNEIKIKTVLCPGLGTATGRMNLKEASRQMAVAYKNFKNPTTNMTWPNLKKRNDEIVGVSLF